MDREKYKKLLHSIFMPGTLTMEERNKRYQPIIDFLQTEIPPSLYRYRSCGELSFGAFSEDQLWFSKPKVMNDDFDALNNKGGGCKCRIETSGCLLQLLL